MMSSVRPNCCTDASPCADQLLYCASSSTTSSDVSRASSAVARSVDAASTPCLSSRLTSSGTTTEYAPQQPAGYNNYHSKPLTRSILSQPDLTLRLLLLTDDARKLGMETSNVVLGVIHVAREVRIFVSLDQVCLSGLHTHVPQ